MIFFQADRDRGHLPAGVWNGTVSAGPLSEGKGVLETVVLLADSRGPCDSETGLYVFGVGRGEPFGGVPEVAFALRVV
jgi:hypothetical protein